MGTLRITVGGPRPDPDQVRPPPGVPPCETRLDPARPPRLQPVLAIQPGRLEPGPLEHVSILGERGGRPTLMAHQRSRELRRPRYQPADFAPPDRETEEP